MLHIGDAFDIINLIPIKRKTAFRKAEEVKKFYLLTCVFTAIIAIYAQIQFKNRVTFAEEKKTLRWSVRFGRGWEDSLGSPVIVGNDVIVFSDYRVYKLGLSDGKTVNSRVTDHRVGFNVAQPSVFEIGGRTYIASGFSDGTVACFDVGTLEERWSYKNDEGGQCLSPVLFYGDMLYAGFRIDETSPASLVALKADSGEKVWEYSHKGGFYWSGGTIADGMLVIGADDGVDRSSTGVGTGKGKLFAFNAADGTLVCELDLVGDVRCGVTYLQDRKEILVVTKAGYLYSVLLGENGALTLRGGFKLRGGQSTGKPAVYNGKIYVFSGSLIDEKGYAEVVNLADFSLVRTIDCGAYPQCGAVLVPDGEAVDVYFDYNGYPGGIRCFRDGKDMDGEECFDYFVPPEELREYCVGSLSVSGNLLVYKNDSNAVFCVELKPTSGVINDENGDVFVTAKSYNKEEIREVLETDVNLLDTEKVQSMLYSVEIEYGKGELYDGLNQVYAEVLARDGNLERLNAEIKRVCVNQGEVGLSSRDKIFALYEEYNALPQSLKDKIDCYEYLNRAYEKVNASLRSLIVSAILAVTAAGLTVALIVGIGRRKKKRLLETMPETDE